MLTGVDLTGLFQQLDHRIAIPIAVTGVGGTLAGGIGSLVTIVVNAPINEELATWNPEALPVGYETLLRRWWEWHQVRLVATFTGMCLVFVAMLKRK